MRPHSGQTLVPRTIGTLPVFVGAEERLRAARAAADEARRIEECARAVAREVKRARSLRDIGRAENWAERLIDDDIAAAARAVQRVRDMLATARSDEAARRAHDDAAVRLAHADRLARQALASLVRAEGAVWDTPERAAMGRRGVVRLGAGLVVAGALVAAAFGAPEAVGAVSDALGRLP